MLAIKFKPPIVETRHKQGDDLTISRAIFEIIDSNNFWENLMLLIEILNPYCKILNVLQSDKAYLFQVIHGLGYLSQCWSNYSNTELATKIINRLEQRWEGWKQPLRGFGRTLLRKLRAGFLAQREIIAHRLLGGFVQRHEPLLVALAAHDQHALIALRRRGRQRDQLGHPHASRVQHFEQAVEPRGAQPLSDCPRTIIDSRTRRREQLIDMAHRQHLGQCAAALRPFDSGSRVILAVPFRIEKAIELADGRKPPCDRGRRKSAAAQPPEIVANRVTVRRRDRAAMLTQIAGEILEITPISFERVRRGATLGRQHVEIEIDQPLVGIHANRSA